MHESGRPLGIQAQTEWLVGVGENRTRKLCDISFGRDLRGAPRPLYGPASRKVTDDSHRPRAQP